MPNPIRRIRAFWICHGEWLLLGAVFLLALSTGYTIAAQRFHSTVVAMQAEYQKELAGERKYLRGVIDAKNRDIKQLSEVQGKLAIKANDTALKSLDVNAKESKTSD